MVLFSQVVVIVAVSWLITIALASRYDLQKYKVYISTGVLIWESEGLEALLKRIIEKVTILSRLGKIATFVALVLFFSTPIILLVNLIKGLFFDPTPILFSNPFSVFRAEVFMLAIPAIFITISIHQLVRAIGYLNEGGEIESVGVLVLGVIVTFFSRLNFDKLSSKSKSKVLSLSLIINLLVLLISLPLFSASMAVVGAMYGEPSGAVVLTISPDSPADNAGMVSGQIIFGIKLIEDNTVVSEINITSATSFRATLRQLSPGVEFIIVLESSQVSIVGDPPLPNQPQSGVYVGLHVTDYFSPPLNMPVLLPLWTETFFNWLLNISLVYGLYIILPLPKSDGSRLLEHVTHSWGVRLSPRAVRFLQISAIGLLALNILLV